MEAIAKTRHLKGSPRKARLVIDLIRGRNVSQALNILKFTDKRAADPIAKTLRSAIANATYLAEQQNIAIDPDDLWVKTCFVDMGAHKNRRRMRPAPQGRAFRIGGMVVPGSLKRDADTLTVRFRVTDTAQTIDVVYTGLLPDLFKEGKGVVAQGSLQPDGTFKATEVLAKHDENYMPPEAGKALQDAQQKGGSMQSTATPYGARQ